MALGPGELQNTTPPDPWLRHCRRFLVLWRRRHHPGDFGVVGNRGLEIVTPAFTPYVVPITITILLLLFSVQRYGTARMAFFFGPITLVWFLALGFFGLWHLFDDLSVLAAANPYYGFDYIVRNRGTAFATIDTVFLAVTGAEALYADLGHFGRRPIATAWMWIVFPCLLLNYFGQGAFVLAHAESAKNPFSAIGNAILAG